jgi:hypothetical protein
VECVGWDGGGRTQDILSELEAVSVCREPLDGNMTPQQDNIPFLNTVYSIPNALLTRY